MSKDLYKRPYTYFGSYYIHLHAHNIGKLNGGTFNDIYTSFEGYKENNTTKALMKQYAYLTNQMITNNTDSNIKQLLDYDLDPERGNRVLNSLDQVIKEGLQEVTNTKNINKILANSSNKSISTWSATTINDMKKLGQQLNEMLAILQESFELFRKEGKSVLITLAEEKSMGDYANSLEDAIRRLKNKLKKGVFDLDKDQINHTLNKMESIITALRSGKTSKGEDLTYNALKHSFNQYVFSTGLGEAIAFKSEDLAKSTILQGLENMDLTGGSTTKIQLFDADGKPTSSREGVKAYGKADIQFPYISLSFADEVTGESGNIVMSIGISNKLYKTVKFSADNETRDGEFSVGGGLTLDQALRQSFNSQRLLYLAYNIFGWNNDSQVSNAVINLQDIIFTRSILNIFSSRGISDFAGYLLLNGKIVSVLEVINYALQHNIGVSHSKQAELGDNATAISFSLGSSKQHNAIIAFQKHLKDWSPRERSSSVVDAIKSSSLHGYIRPAKLIQALGTQNIKT